MNIAEVIHVDDDDVQPPQKDTEKETSTSIAPQATTQNTPPEEAPRAPPAAALTVSLEQGPSQAGTGLATAPSTVRASTPTVPVNIFNLYKVPEDQTGASKEAMIQAELMTQRLQEICAAGNLAYDASSALQENVRVSALVSRSLSHVSLVVISVGRYPVHPLGVFCFRPSLGSGGPLRVDTASVGAR